MLQQQTARDVRAIGETGSHQPGRVEAVVACGVANEACKVIGALREVFLIEHAFAQPPKKSQCPRLVHLSARTEHRRAWQERATERNEVVFVAAGTVEQEQGIVGVGTGSGYEAV